MGRSTPGAALAQRPDRRRWRAGLLHKRAPDLLFVARDERESANASFVRRQRVVANTWLTDCKIPAPLSSVTDYTN